MGNVEEEWAHKAAKNEKDAATRNKTLIVIGVLAVAGIAIAVLAGQGERDIASSSASQDTPSERRRLASLISDNMREQGLGEILVTTRGSDDEELTFSSSVCNTAVLKSLADNPTYQRLFRKAGVRKISCSSGAAEMNATW